VSSLTELYRMPFSELKVDHALIADVVREREAMLIVQAIAKLAHTLELEVCAGGVETREMLGFVQSNGFDSAQGRFFSGPVKPAEIERLVATLPCSEAAATGRWRVMRSLT
jgi:EAL domain-containing protein (putative c-di-GMP-specific phosphodiesterase class I)